MSRQDRKRPTHGRRARPAAAKARTPAGRGPRAELEKQLELRTRELAEALEQQAATSDVLAIISRSPGQLEPVFEAILEKAVRICDAKFGNLLLYDGSAFRFAAVYGAPAAWDKLRQRDPVIPRSEGSPLDRAIASKRPQHIADLRKHPAYLARVPATVPMVELAGARTLVVVPMLKDKELIGAIAIYRQEVRPFTQKQIDLVVSFAAQAVIAIDNTRCSTSCADRCSSRPPPPTCSR